MVARSHDLDRSSSSPFLLLYSLFAGVHFFFFYKSFPDLTFNVQRSSFNICARFLMSSTCPSETFRLGPFNTPRIWTGLWQLSSNAWGSASVSKVRSGMARYVEMGYTAFGGYNLPAMPSPLLTSFLSDMVCSFATSIRHYGLTISNVKLSSG